MQQNLVMYRATFRGVGPNGQGSDPTEWIVGDLLPTFRRACPGFVNATIVPGGAFIHVYLLVSEEGLQAYRNSDHWHAIAVDALAHGFSEGTDMAVTYFISDDDGSPSSGHGHGPESRDSGNFESAVHHFG